LSGNAPHQREKSFFCIDNDLIYWNFFLDFGPLNLGHLYRYCALLNNKLSDPKLKDRVIYHYCGNHPHKRANSAFLIAAWSILYLNKTPDESYRPFKFIQPPFPTWHDATPGVCHFPLTVLDTLKGLFKARECGFFDFNKFNIEEYEHYEQVENGDLNWTMANKFIAFAGPHAARESHPGGYTSLIPDDYIPYFKRKNVKLVVRLNKKYYDSRKFTSQGIDHMELYFLDGSNPPDILLARFLEKVENCDGAVAVHCKAGLGRTGCVVGCYMMKHYRCTGEEVIGWLRIVRPGSIIGPQQQWLREMCPRMWREGDLFRSKRGEGAAGLGDVFANDALAGRATGRSRDTEGGTVENISTGMKVMHVSGTRAGAGAKDSATKNSEELGERTQGDYLRERRRIAANEYAAAGNKKPVNNFKDEQPKGDPSGGGGDGRFGRFFSSFGGK
jgi:cell division cycle 14